MKSISVALSLALVLCWSPTHATQKLVDCPLRDAPFSSRSPLIDVLLSPAARATLEQSGVTLLNKMPPSFFGTTAPSFGAIVTLREAMGFFGEPLDRLPEIDAALAKLPVTPEDRIARCARYDVEPPVLTIPRRGPRVLLFEKINGFRDDPSVKAAHAAFVAIAARKGWELVTTDKGSAFNAQLLRKFDAVIWNNISGDVLTLTQRAVFQRWLQQGGGFIGVHGTAGDPVYFWDWYADTLIGARFSGHPMNPQFQDARVVIDDAAHPIARGLPAEWVVNDEWYSFKTNPRVTGARIIATLDESTYSPTGMRGEDLKMGDHPIAWTRCVGRGRVFYSAIGHRPERYADAVYVQMLEQAIGWAMLEKRACRANP